MNKNKDKDTKNDKNEGKPTNHEFRLWLTSMSTDDFPLSVL